jgi:hypothetical protein
MKNPLAKCLDYIRTNPRSDLAMAVLFFAAVTGLGTAQENAAGASATAQGNVKGKHFMISYAAPSSSRSDDDQKKAPEVLQSVGEGIAQRLTADGLVRVPALDIQCCNLQLTLLQGGPDAEVPKTRRNALSIRASVLDIDNQPLYTKNFSGAATGSDAVEGLVKSVLADPKIMRILKGD